MHHLESIIKFYKKRKRLPSYAEIMTATGLRSKNSVHKLVNRLCQSQIIARDDHGRIVPGPKLLGLSLLGTVEAGWPSPAEEELAGTMTLDEYLISRREATYLLRVSGESMIEAGIMPGDLLLVERGREARDGDIVVAEIDHDWTLKYFRRLNGKVLLAPANKKFRAIEPRDELKIAAVVVGVVRRYQKN